MSQRVFIMRYEHRHGVDMSAYATEELAYRERAEIALKWAHELPNDADAARVRELYANGDYSAAGSVYLDCHTNETIEIDDLEIEGSDANIRVLDSDKLVHHALTLPTSRYAGVTSCAEMFWWSSCDVESGWLRVTLPPEQPPLSCLVCVVRHDE